MTAEISCVSYDFILIYIHDSTYNAELTVCLPTTIVQQLNMSSTQFVRSFKRKLSVNNDGKI
jgi:hypothetical protein